MPRIRRGRSPPINGTDHLHASKRPFPRHGCAITNSGRASRESTTFMAIAICSAPASRSRTLEIPKNKRRFLALVGIQAFGPVFRLCLIKKRKRPQKRVRDHPSLSSLIRTKTRVRLGPRNFYLSHSLRHDFSDRFHALGCSVGMDGDRAVARNSSGSKGAAFENAIQNFFDAKSKTVGFGKAFDLRFAVARPQNDRELAEAVNSLVVHFHNNDPFELREDLFNAVR